MDARQRLEQIQAEIAQAARDAGRDPAGVGLLAVSKGQPAEALASLVEVGQTAYGESYLQEALDKQARLPAGLAWHFIGRIQRNKTRAIAAAFDWVHTVDRLNIAQRLSDQRPAGRPPLQLCIQVNVSADPRKGGITPDGLADLAHQVTKLPRLRLRGLMTMPSAASDPEAQRAPYRRLRELRDRLVADGLPLDTLSMGLSADFRAAVAEGASWVRIGTALFGPRPA